MADSRLDLCSRYGCEYTPVSDLEIVGLAITTLERLPVNGLRHSPSAGTTGWYLWCGENLSEAADFFKPYCVVHAVEKLPEISRFLGLPPGYRFLTDGKYIDIWYDANLLTAE